MRKVSHLSRRICGNSGVRDQPAVYANAIRAAQSVIIAAEYPRSTNRETSGIREQSAIMAVPLSAPQRGALLGAWMLGVSVDAGTTGTRRLCSTAKL